MSQYFMSPSFPELTIRPASFFPFTIINFSLTHSTLKKRQTRTFDNRILLLKIQSIIIVVYHLCHHHSWHHYYHHHWRFARTLWSRKSFSMHFCSLPPLRRKLLWFPSAWVSTIESKPTTNSADFDRYSPILETSPETDFSSEYLKEMLLSYIFASSVVICGILSNERRS